MMYQRTNVSIYVLGSTVKLGDKERFDKEKIGVKELLLTILNHKFTVR